MRGWSLLGALRLVRLPPGLILLPDHPDINRGALILSMVLLFLSRAAQFQQQNEFLDAAVATLVFATSASAISFMRRRIQHWAENASSENKLAKLLLSLSDTKNPNVPRWLCFLLTQWNISLFLVLLEWGLNFWFGFPTLANFFLSTKVAAIVFSVLAFAIIAGRTILLYGARFGGGFAFLKYFVVAVFVNSVMLYFFVYWTPSPA